MSYHHDIYWVKIGEDVQPKMLMVMGLKNDGALSVAWNANVTHYEGCVVDRLIGLRIFNVSSSDLGMYFCTASSKKRMEFGEGIRLHSNSEMASSSDGLFQTYLIIASALSCGMILMVVTIITVFVKTNREKRESDGKQKLYQI
ncbi:hypothetical protein NFI96_021757 [Prochilodus magdalenae]|nr:hypothetical protein NFI96_021757 [Prochilodus magdalenae]